MYKILRNYISIMLIFFVIDLVCIINGSMFNILGYIPTIHSLFGMYWYVIIPIVFLITKYTYTREIDKEDNFDYYIDNRFKIRLIIIIFNIIIGITYAFIYNDGGYSICYIITTTAFIFILKSKKELFRYQSTKTIKEFKEEQEKKNLK